MTFKELAAQRVSAKFANGNNYKNVLRFMTNIFDKTRNDITLIKNLKNLDSDSGLVLDELGKLLGVYPRPYVEVGVATEGFMAWDLYGWDTLPFYTLGSEDIRQLSDTEYVRLLKAASVLVTFNGTMDDWLKLLEAIADAPPYIVNKASSFDIIILQSLSTFDKNLIELFLSGLNNLTVNIGFLGTSDGVQPMQFDVTGWDTAAFIEPW